LSESDVKPRGYFKIINEDTLKAEYIKCNENGCSKSTLSSTSCTSSNIGQLIMNNSEAKLCLSSSEMVGFSSGSAKVNYILNINGKTVFSDNTSSQILLSVTNNSFRPINISESM